ncbi:hypothetical protein [Rhizobium sp. A37_96]
MNTVPGLRVTWSSTTVIVVVSRMMIEQTAALATPENDEARPVEACGPAKQHAHLARRQKTAEKQAGSTMHEPMRAPEKCQHAYQAGTVLQTHQSRTEIPSDVGRWPLSIA